jgi:GMP synthase-like glutamine amidotransferase
MKFFIVDNGSRYLENIVLRLADAGHEYHIQAYSPFKLLDPKDADCIILSGGMQNEVADDLDNGDPWYRHEFDLIRTTQLPILGICLGLQMIAVAFGGSLRKLPHLIETDTKHVHLSNDAKRYFASIIYTVHEKHQWVVDSYASTGLKMLAYSEDGVEMLYHPTRHIIGTQFHPEIDVSSQSKEIFWSLVNHITAPVGVAHAA